MLLLLVNRNLVQQLVYEFHLRLVVREVLAVNGEMIFERDDHLKVGAMKSITDHVQNDSSDNLLEIAEADGEYVPAQATIRSDRLILEAEGVSYPVRARYAWTDYSSLVNLFGENELPVEPFSL